MTLDPAKLQRTANASRKLSQECLKILPADNLLVTGMALVHLVSIWLNAVPEDQRVQAYMDWIDTLHEQLHAGGVLGVNAVIEALDDPSNAVH